MHLESDLLEIEALTNKKGAAASYETEGHTENLRGLFEMYDKAQIRPRICASFPLEKAADALVMMQDRKVLGKVVLTID